jgi:hypothetical protein
LDLDVTRSVASATPFVNIHSALAAVNSCIAGVEGVKPLIAAIATVLSVNEYTCSLAASGCSATNPKVEAANSRSQISNDALSSADHRSSQ